MREMLEISQRITVIRNGKKIIEAPTEELNEKQLDGLRQRRQAMLDHVDAMVARFGEAAVLPW